jgi:creatinine amidohydrolase
MKTRQIQYLRPDEILPELHRVPAAYLPLGLIEWHGPHLPFGVDAFNAEAIAIRAAEQSGGLVLPTLYFGTERDRDPQNLENIGFEPDAHIVGMDFPANSLPSMYAREDLFALILRENLRLAAAMGFKIIVPLSGHGAVNQLETIRRVAVEFNARGSMLVLPELAFAENEDGVLAVGHASRIETSIMLALAPDTVRIDLLPPSGPLKNLDFAIVDYPTFMGQPTPDRTVSADDDPRKASAADGEAMLDRTARRIAARVQQALKDHL